MEQYCVACHKPDKAKGELDLTVYNSEQAVIKDFRQWQAIVEFIKNAEMPPKKYKQQPSLDSRRNVLSAIDTILVRAARSNAGDPGIIPGRRLSNAEYNNTVSMLIGHRVDPTATFPPDRAGGEGFDNVSEALDMSPGLIKKYLKAAQDISQHLALTPDGIEFGPEPLGTQTARTRLAESPILAFYRQHTPRIRDYITAAWRYTHHEQNQDVRSWAKDQGLSGKYLETVLRTLNDASKLGGYFTDIGKWWEALEAPVQHRIPDQIDRIVKRIETLRRHLFHLQKSRQTDILSVSASTWAVDHMVKRRQLAADRRRYPVTMQTAFKRVVDLSKNGVKKVIFKSKASDGSSTFTLHIDDGGDGGEGSEGDYVLIERPVITNLHAVKKNFRNITKGKSEITLRELLQATDPQQLEDLAFGKHPAGHPIDPNSLIVKAPTTLSFKISAKAHQKLGFAKFVYTAKIDPHLGANSLVGIRASYCGRQMDEDITLLTHTTGDKHDQVRHSAERFCSVFPLSYAFVHPSRNLSAGFHLVDGYFRDDQALCELVLDKDQVTELDALWDRLNFITNHAEILLRGFLWFERNERNKLREMHFPWLRIADPALTQDPLLARVETEYHKRVSNNAATKRFFADIREGLNWHTGMKAKAEAAALQQLPHLIERAFGRKPTTAELESLLKFYKTLRNEHEANAEQALRGVFSALLTSPQFMYLEFTPSSPDTELLPDRSLARRLSYFLWSGPPDEELLTLAAANQLQDDQQLRQQTKRMLAHPRVSHFARSFFGQWLRYKAFTESTGADKQVLPHYSPELHRALGEEPTRLTTYLLHEDAAVTELLTGDRTVVNGPLAMHYGGKIWEQYLTFARKQYGRQADGLNRYAAGESRHHDSFAYFANRWIPVTGLRQQGRGGLAGLPIVLTINSTGLRTSPVKRGFWIVHHLLGQHFPPPPADVAQLPDSEEKAKQSIRVLLAKHSQDPNCAVCHDRFDHFGLTAEGFDSTGKQRMKDGAGRPVDSMANLPGGQTAQNLSDLADYLYQHQRDAFIATFSRKLLGYALGRSVLLSDRPLLEKMQAQLQSDNYRFSSIFMTIITSKQFRQVRGVGTVPGKD